MDFKLEEKAEGIFLAGRFSTWKVGAWLLQAGGECAVFEMPPPTTGAEHPAMVVKKALEKRRWKCRYLFFSHPHWDHTASIHEYRQAFPEALFVVHYSAPLFFKMSEYYWTRGHLAPKRSPWAEVKEKSGKEWFLSSFNEIFFSDILELTLGGEPLFLIYGPKHSLGDVHCVFRGVWCSGDWWLFEGDPCQDRAASSKAEESITRLKSFSLERSYLIHTIFSAHADNLLYGVNLDHVLERTLAYHRDYEKKASDGLDWKNFTIRTLYAYFFPAFTLPAEKKP
ncbi:MAG: MBL fold metallo-hydrolase [Candidatus Eremiobacteraeota bacterium]|nr:MBL fold metallo-hydrolase [Candidatus Eremiobacteraeota bacterium]